MAHLAPLAVARKGGVTRHYNDRVDASVTAALDDWARGDRSALDRLAPLVYPQLRDLAAAFLHRERSSHTLQPTALVSELFLKLIAQREPRYQDRRHFYNACAQLMRLALIDHARHASREKRGGVQPHVPLHEEMAWFNAAGPEVIDLDRLLKELAQLDPDQVAMFESRYLLGCSVDETAALFQTSPSTVDRKIRIARAWLYARLVPESQSESSSG